MSALALYLAVAAALFILWSRYVRRLSAAAALVLVLLPLCFTGRAMLTGRVYAPADLAFESEPLKDYAADFGIASTHNGMLSDVHAQIIPWRAAVRYAYSLGEWPLWNPFILCGDILAQAAQPAPYDPFNLLSLLISLPAAVTFAATITFFLAAFSTFVFAREHGLREWPSVTAGAAYMACGIMAFFVAWPLARAWAFMPLVLFGVRAVVRHRTLGAAAMLTLTLVLEVFAGHPESLFHVVVVGTLYGVFELAVERRGTLRAIGLATLSGLAAVGLTAVFLLPFVDATGQTFETVIRTQHFAANPLDTSAEVVSRKAGIAFLPWFGLANEGRSVTRYWDPQIARVGGLGLALALGALALAWRRSVTWFFAALAVLSLLAAFDTPPLADWLHALPLFEIALNDRLAFAACFALSMLAGLGVDSWSASRTRLAGAALMLACVGALALATALAYKPHANLGMDPGSIKLLAAIDLVPAVIVALLLATRVPARIAVPVTLALLLAQRVAEDGRFYPALPSEAFYPRVPLIDAIPQAGEPYRVVGHRYALVPGSGAHYRVEDPRGYQAMTFLRMVETYPWWSIPQPVWFNRVDDLTTPFLSMVNVRYAISAKSLPTPAGWAVAASDRQSVLLENDGVFSRAFVPKRIAFERDGVAVREKMENAKDFREISWIEAPDIPPQEVANGPGVVTTRRDGLAYELDARMDRAGWVIVTNSAWDGWRATVDGTPVPIRFANHAFLGIHVAAGSHRVRLEYRPDSFVLGRAISLATLASLLVAGAVYATARRRRVPATAS